MVEPTKTHTSDKGLLIVQCARTVYGPCFICVRHNAPMSIHESRASNAKDAAVSCRAGTCCVRPHFVTCRPVPCRIPLRDSTCLVGNSYVLVRVGSRVWPHASCVPGSSPPSAGLSTAHTTRAIKHGFPHAPTRRVFRHGTYRRKEKSGTARIDT